MLLIRDDPPAFDELRAKKEEIETEIGELLTWMEPVETRTGRERSKIKIERDADLSREESWDEYHDWLIEQGESFHEVFYDRIQNL